MARAAARAGLPYTRGSDVVKAVALGARAVLIGRAYLYGLGAAGERGVDHVLHLFDADVRRTMACSAPPPSPTSGARSSPAPPIPDRFEASGPCDSTGPCAGPNARRTGQGVRPR